MTDLSRRHADFSALHDTGCFVIPNPWDAGSAKVMAALGARALATTSAGFAFTLGRPDMGHVSRDEALRHAEDLVAATPLPVSGDFENGFADDPDEVAATIRLAASVGLSGCSIEDTMMIEGNPAYPFDLAVERVRAAASAARSLGRPFVFCARADGVMNGAYDVEESIRRIRAFEQAGADLLYVPAPSDMSSLSRIVASVSRPVNALASGAFARFAKSEFEAIGVRRISVGSAVARATHKTLVDATRAILDAGDFTRLTKTVAALEIDTMLGGGSAADY